MSSPARRWALVFTVGLVAGGGCKGGGGGFQVISAAGDFAPSTLVFPTIPVGDPEQLSVQLSNPTTVDLPLGAPQVSGDFSVLSSVPAVVPALQTITLQMQFLPTAVGARAGSLVLPTPGLMTKPLTLALSGQGTSASSVEIQINPAALDFGTLLLGEAVTEVLQVYNPNDFEVAPTYGAPMGGDPPQFAAAMNGQPLSPDGGFLAPLLAQGTANLAITFAPSTSAMSLGSLALAACPTCSPTTVNFKGTGIDAHLVFDPPHLDFGFVLNSVYPPPVKNVTVANAGNLPLTLLSLTAPPNSPFTLGQVPNSPTLDSDAGVPFTVTYSPSGAASDRIEIAAKWSVTPPGSSTTLYRTTYLPAYGNQGLGPCQLQVIPDSGINFGSSQPGATLTENLQLINLGEANCVVAVDLDPTSSSAFSLQTPPDGGQRDGGWLVYGHGSTLFPVTFTTTADTHHLVFKGAVEVTGSGVDQKVALNASLASGYAAGSAWPKWGHDNSNTGQGDYDTSKTTGKLRWRSPMPAILPPAELTARNFATRFLYDAGGFANFEVAGPGVDNYEMFAPSIVASGANTVGPVLADNGNVLGIGGPRQQSLYAFQPSDGGLAYWLPLGTLNLLGGQYNSLQPYQPNQFAVVTPVVSADGLIALESTQDGPYEPQLNLFYVSLNSYQTIAFSSSYPVQGVYVSAPPLMVPGAIDLLYDVINQPVPAPCLWSIPQQTTNPLSNPPCFSGLIPVEGLPSGALDLDQKSYWCGQGVGQRMAGPNGCAQVDTARALRDWFKSFDPAFVGAPVLGFGNLFVDAFQEVPVPVPGRHPTLQYQSIVYALDPSSGEVVWQYQLPPLPVPPTGRAPDVAAGIPGLDYHPDRFAQAEFHLALGDDGALVVAYVDGIYCIEATGANAGTLRWKLPVSGGSLSAASLGLDNTAYIGTVDQGLLAIDTGTGALRWSFPLPPSAPAAIDSDGLVVKSITARPAVADQVIYFVADDNYLYAIQ